MDPLEKCTSVLRHLMTQASDPNSVVLAENAMDAYLAAFNTGQSKTGAIAILQTAVTGWLPKPSGAQLDLTHLILDYLDKHMRELREQT